MPEVIVDLNERTISWNGDVITLDDVQLFGSQVGWAGLALLAQNANRIATDMAPKFRTEEAEQYALLGFDEDGAERKPACSTPGIVLTGMAQVFCDTVVLKLADEYGLERGDADSEAYLLACKWAARYPEYLRWDGPAVRSLARTMVWQHMSKQSRKENARLKAESEFTKRKPQE